MTQLSITQGVAKNGATEIAYEIVGEDTGETLIFISGLGSQLVFWTDEFCQLFIDRGFRVIRFDNRDSGLSSKTAGTPPSTEEIIQDSTFQPPYTLVDMAADTVAVLDAVGVEKAHVVGTSLGGGVAQSTAIAFPERVKTMTSIMSAPTLGVVTEARDDQDERDDAVAASLTMDMSDPTTYVDIQVEGWRATSGPHFDPVYQRKILQKSFDRCYHPDGWSYQMMAARAGGDRSPQLAQLKMPVLVIHGALDPLVPPIGGEATAAAIPHAKYLLIEDMGHNFPRPRWNQIADAIKALSATK